MGPSPKPRNFSSGLFKLITTQPGSLPAYCGERLQPGMSTVLSTQEGYRSVTVVKVGSSVIDVDLNHPMAGKTLHFAIEIVDIRAQKRPMGGVEIRATDGLLLVDLDAARLGLDSTTNGEPYPGVVGRRVEQLEQQHAARHGDGDDRQRDAVRFGDQVVLRA
mgnify:CR=1 FL=1